MQFVKDNAVTISMDGRSSGHDKVFVERLEKFINYDDVCSRSYGTVSQVRPHNALDAMTPDKYYRYVLLSTPDSPATGGVGAEQAYPPHRAHALHSQQRCRCPWIGKVIPDACVLRFK